MQCAQLKKLDLSWNCLDTPLGSTNEAYEKSPCNLHKSPKRDHKVHVRCVLVGIYLSIFFGVIDIFSRMYRTEDHRRSRSSTWPKVYWFGDCVFCVPCVPCVLFYLVYFWFHVLVAWWILLGVPIIVVSDAPMVITIKGLANWTHSILHNPMTWVSPCCRLPVLLKYPAVCLDGWMYPELECFTFHVLNRALI